MSKQKLTSADIIQQAESWDGTSHGIYQYIRDHTDKWSKIVTSGGSFYAKIADYLVRPGGLDTCESCGRSGEWLVSDICVRCHKAVCAHCARLHYRMNASLCHDCYIRSCQDFLREARRKSTMQGRTEQAYVSS